MRAAVTAIGILAGVYFATAFVVWEIDPGDWPPVARAVAAFLGVTFALPPIIIASLNEPTP